MNGLPSVAAVRDGKSYTMRYLQVRETQCKVLHVTVLVFLFKIW